MSIAKVLNNLDLMYIIIKFRKVAQLEYIKENFRYNKKLLIKELSYIKGEYEYSNNRVCKNCGISYNLKICRNNCVNNDKCLKCTIKIYNTEFYS
tara:strand:- start:144 stop:428 length:285 start_codon:yes stop_codon:yes gene_type:complete